MFGVKIDRESMPVKLLGVRNGNDTCTDTGANQNIVPTAVAAPRCCAKLK